MEKCINCGENEVDAPGAICLECQEREEEKEAEEQMLEEAREADYEKGGQ